jgi:LmbE family N-acetylglucosaminyl deacetylase
VPPIWVFIEPHADDGVLSGGLGMIDAAAKGIDVHLITMNRGGNGGPLGQLNGDQMCNWHGFRHNPAREGYAPLTTADIAQLRVDESRSAIGAIGAITPNPGVPAAGKVFHHVADLPDGFGGVAGKPPTPEGVAMAKEYIAGFIDEHPNGFYNTMSPSEATGGHPDHAACGIALRQLKQSKEYGPLLPNARFVVSKRYWGPPRPAAVAAEKPTWYVAGRIKRTDGTILDRKPEFDALLRKMVAPCYGAWNPAGLPEKGSAGVGYHQVSGQFANCFGPTVDIGNLWHG